MANKRIQITTRGQSETSFVSDKAFADRNNEVFGDVLKYKVNHTDGAEFFEPLNADNGGFEIVDLVKESWHVKGVGQPNTDDIPFIKIKEFQPRFSSGITNLMSSFNNLLSVFEENNPSSIITQGGIVSEPIAHSLIARKTGFIYKLPLLIDTSRTYATQFGSGEDGNSGGVFSDLKQAVLNNSSIGGENAKGLAKMLSSTTGLIGSGVLSNLTEISNIFYPAVNNISQSEKFYTASIPSGFQFTVDLVNTSGDYQTMLKHRDIVNLMANNFGSGSVRNKHIGTGPCIFELEIYGALWIPACKIDFSYQPHGNFKTIGDYSFSEAMTLTLDVMPFFPALRKIDIDYIHNGKKHHAISTDMHQLCNTLQRFFDFTGNIDFKSAF